MITLDQVRSFVAVAEELHFGRAAERLRMTQPPLSRQIQKLEKSIGAQLLERDNRRVELTGAGAAFLDEAYRLLNLVDSAGDLARRVDAGAAGVVRHSAAVVAGRPARAPDGGRPRGASARGPGSSAHAAGLRRAACHRLPPTA